MIIFLQNANLDFDLAFELRSGKILSSPDKKYF